MAKKTDRLFIIDGSYLIYRSFHAIPSTFTSSSGIPTNAVYGFTQTLRKILKDYSPEYIAVAFDSRGPSFRHERFSEYKSERPPMPDDLSVQIPYIKRIVRAFNIPALEAATFEADDIMATVDRRMEDMGVRVVLITGDKDMCQLVDSDTVMLDYNADRELGPREVEEKFGVGPGLIRDLLGLAGDASDNIPGVPGIGPKTAAKLLAEFGSIEGVYANLDRVKGKKLREKLEEFKDQAMLSRELATLHMDVPLDVRLEDLKEGGPDSEELSALLKELGFNRILSEMGPGPSKGAGADGAPETACETITVTKNKDFAGLAAEVKEAGTFSITISTAPPGVGGVLQWAAAAGQGRAYFMPVKGEQWGEGAGLEEGAVVEALAGLFKSAAAAGAGLLTDDSKALHLFFAARGVAPAMVECDTSIASYLVNPSRPSHTVEVLSGDLLDAPLVDPRKKSGRTKKGQGPG
ncbi:MAG: 5'-3' exonuclease H3TH domain-containing protein, partial [Thermodesulfobacteriota bacterium]